MMRHFIRVTGIIISLTLLLAVTTGSVQAGEARHVSSISADDAEQAEDTALVCLALVGSAALLAGGVWMSMLRRTLS